MSSCFLKKPINIIKPNSNLIFLSSFVRGKKHKKPVFAELIERKQLIREKEPFLDSKWESEYIVGPYIKEIRPQDPWLIPRLGIDDLYKEVIIEKKEEFLDIILIEHVSGVGVKGDIVKVDEKLAFSYLIPSQKAVYATDENKFFYKKLIEEKQPGGPSTALSPITAQKLKEKIFLITMSDVNSWELEKKHIKISLRRQNVIVKEDAIELPEEKILGPNILNEGKDFVAYVTINNNSYEKIPVRFMLHHMNFELEPDWYNKRPRSVLLNSQKKLIETLKEPPIEEVFDILESLKRK